MKEIKMNLLFWTLLLSLKYGENTSKCAERSIYGTLKYTLMRFLLKLIKLNIILNTLPLKL